MSAASNAIQAGLTTAQYTALLRFRHSALRKGSVLSLEFVHFQGRSAATALAANGTSAIDS